MHAELCPICKGTGIYKPSKEEIKSGEPHRGSGTCHGCRGTGWVSVADDPVPYQPPIYAPPTLPTRWTPWWPPYTVSYL